MTCSFGSVVSHLPKAIPMDSTRDSTMSRRISCFSVLIFTGNVSRNVFSHRLVDFRTIDRGSGLLEPFEPDSLSVYSFY